jgi:hypothetical protein
MPSEAISVVILQIVQVLTLMLLECNKTTYIYHAACGLLSGVIRKSPISNINISASEIF